MRTAALLLAALLLGQPQEKDREKDKTKEQQQVPKDVIKDWRYRQTDTRFDPKTKTEVEEVTVIVQGKEATPIDVDKKIFDLRGVKANYFTSPDKDKLSKEIVVAADQGRYDHSARTLQLRDNVRVVKKNDDEKPPQVDSVLDASRATLRFNRMYECPRCQEPLKLPGRCLTHNEPLKELTITSLDVDSEFVLAGPEGILSGEGLETDDEIRKKYHIRKNGFVEFGGDASTRLQGKKAGGTPEATFSQVFSRGPLRITGPVYARRIVGEGGVRVDRIDSAGTLTIRAQNLTIDTKELGDPRTQKLGPPEIREVEAVGKAVLDGVMFEDGMAFQTTSDSLVRSFDGEFETITLKSSDVPVHVKSGPNTIEARNVRIIRREKETGGRSEFETVLRSDLVAGGQHFNLKADRLVTTAEPNDAGRTELRKLHAEGRVVLGGLMAGRGGSNDAPGEAHADVFDWDVKTEHGLLEARPFVRITQGPSVIVAPKVVLESPKIIVLKGPKQVTLVQERDGEKEEYRATCDGDMVLDKDVNRLWMRNGCVIRTRELLLHSDRVDARLSPEGTGLEALNAVGRVRALRRADQTTVYGERLAYRFKDQDLKVYGEPYAWAEVGRGTIRQESIRVYEKENPKTKQKVKYTQHEGGPDGLRIEIPESTLPGEKK